MSGPGGTDVHQTFLLDDPGTVARAVGTPYSGDGRGCAFGSAAPEPAESGAGRTLGENGPQLVVPCAGLRQI